MGLASGLRCDFGDVVVGHGGQPAQNVSQLGVGIQTTASAGFFRCVITAPNAAAAVAAVAHGRWGVTRHYPLRQIRKAS